MKIVCTHHENHYTMGLATAATIAGFDFIFWNPAVKPTYDMFDELTPELVLIQQGEQVAGLNEYMRDNPQVKLYERPDDTNYANIVHIKESERVDMPAWEYLYISDHSLNEEQLANIRQICEDIPTVHIIGDFKIDVPQYVGRVSLLDKFAALRNCSCLIDSIKNEYRLDAYFLKKKVYGLDEGQTESLYNNVVSHLTYFHTLSTILNTHGYTNESEQTLKALGEFLNEHASRPNQ